MKIRDLIRSINQRWLIWKIYEIKFDPEDNLTLNKTIEIPIVTIVVRAAFHENNNYYLQAFLDECLYKI